MARAKRSGLKATPKKRMAKRIARRKRRSVVTISKEEYEGLKETIYLLSNPANAQELLAAIADANAGKFEEHGLLDE
jgi:antitoxin YefM